MKSAVEPTVSQRWQHRLDAVLLSLQSTAQAALSRTCCGLRTCRRSANSSTRVSTSCGLVTTHLLLLYLPTSVASGNKAGAQFTKYVTIYHTIVLRLLWGEALEKSFNSAIMKERHTCLSFSNKKLKTVDHFTDVKLPEKFGISLWVITKYGWLSSQVVSVLDSGAVGPGFKSHPRCCRVTVLGKLFTPIVPLFTKQWNW